MQAARAGIRILIGLGVLAVTAVVVSSHTTSSPKLALAIPAVLLSAAVCRRWPGAAVTAALLLTGFSGTLTSVVGFPVLRSINLILVGLWLGVVWEIATGGRRQAAWIWPGVAACGVYIALTAVEIFTASSISIGIKSFETSAWYMLALLLVGYAQWGRETHTRIARAIVVAGITVGAYAVLRKIIGPSHAEQQNALDVAGFGSAVQRPDVTPLLGTELSPIRFFGSFSTAEGLAAFSSISLIASLAFAMTFRSGWRVAAWSSVAFSAFAVFASGTRAGFLAAALGCLIVLALFQLSQGTRRIGTSVVAIVAVLVVGGVAFTIAAGSSGDSAQRYARILSPGNDPAYQTRLVRWRLAFDEAERHPFGEGLGTAGGVAAKNSVYPSIGAIIDNSYLKIALEQGIPVMVFFAGSLLLLVVGLGYRVTATEDSYSAALGAAGAGAIVGLMALFYLGQYNEDVAVLAGWIVVGLGVAQFATVPARAPEPTSEAEPVSLDTARPALAER